MILGEEPVLGGRQPVNIHSVVWAPHKLMLEILKPNRVPGVWDVQDKLMWDCAGRSI